MMFSCISDRASSEEARGSASSKLARGLQVRIAATIFSARKKLLRDALPLVLEQILETNSTVTEKGNREARTPTWKVGRICFLKT